MPLNKHPHLESETIELLRQLVEADRILPRAERSDFIIVERWIRKYKTISREKAEEALKHGVLGRPDGRGGVIRSVEEIPPEYDRDFIQHPSFPSGNLEVAWTDIDSLRLHNLIEVRPDGLSFILNPSARAFVDNLESPALSSEYPELLSYKDDEQHWYGELPQIECLGGEVSHFEPEVVILTAVPVERDAVLRRLKPPTGLSRITEVPVGHETYYLGSLGGHIIALTMCEMGYSGPASSTLATQEAIARWLPRAVIMGGIAFGMHPGRQRIADVLVSRTVHCYELQRVQENVTISRGDSPRAGLSLVNRFSNVPGWRFNRPDGTSVDVKVGHLLSGEKLVDSPQFKAGLLETYPEAIGGEMEGVGLYASAARAKVEWVIVKAICDWADGGKHKRYQPLAAAAAVSLIEHVLTKPNVLANLDRPLNRDVRNNYRPQRDTFNLSTEHVSQQGSDEPVTPLPLKESGINNSELSIEDLSHNTDEHNVALVVAAIEPELRQLEEDRNYDEVNIMDAGIELTNRYLSLPHRLQIKIAKNLGLFQEEDNDKSDVEQFCLFFRRAKEKALLHQLWDRVEEVYISRGGTSTSRNPFTGK